MLRGWTVNRVSLCDTPSQLGRQQSTFYSVGYTGSVYNPLLYNLWSYSDLAA